MTPRARGEDGFFSLWVLGLCCVVLMIGGLSIDLWRAFSERRALAAIADSAAIAGASGIDVNAFRDSGQVVLDAVPGGTAWRLADANIAAQTDTRSFDDAVIDVTPEAVTVTVNGTVAFSLLNYLPIPEDQKKFDVQVVSRARVYAAWLTSGEVLALAPAGHAWSKLLVDSRDALRSAGREKFMVSQLACILSLWHRAAVTTTSHEHIFEISKNLLEPLGIIFPKPISS